MIFFQNILFSKELLACNGCFGLFTKIEKGPGTSFWWTFSAWFCHKNVLYLYLSTDKVSMPYLFSFPRYQTQCVIMFLTQWLTGRKRGEDGNTKIWRSWERKELFRWNKEQFSLFLKGYHLVANKNLRKNSRHKL